MLNSLKFPRLTIRELDSCLSYIDDSSKNNCRDYNEFVDNFPDKGVIEFYFQNILSPTSSNILEILNIQLDGLPNRKLEKVVGCLWSLALLGVDSSLKAYFHDYLDNEIYTIDDYKKTPISILKSIGKKERWLTKLLRSADKRGQTRVISKNFLINLSRDFDQKNFSKECINVLEESNLRLLPIAVFKLAFTVLYYSDESFSIPKDSHIEKINDVFRYLYIPFPSKFKEDNSDSMECWESYYKKYEKKLIWNLKGGLLCPISGKKGASFENYIESNLIFLQKQSLFYFLNSSKEMGKDSIRFYLLLLALLELE